MYAGCNWYYFQGILFLTSSIFEMLRCFIICNLVSLASCRRDNAVIKLVKEVASEHSTNIVINLYRRERRYFEIYNLQLPSFFIFYRHAGV